jgi:hypothetical protein
MGDLFADLRESLYWRRIRPGSEFLWRLPDCNDHCSSIGNANVAPAELQTQEHHRKTVSGG